ncbi:MULTISPECIES: hypothetical protein [unclassified Pseudomonas]|uniref:hypothetical protein n=1 Tax=Pseudomonas sp. URIL14HWK12:I6 TaxID=1283293 RepID=UPI00047F1BB7|nr:hypothetical protein [Pseudomonas sp. URIL14HWK12:I6]
MIDQLLAMVNLGEKLPEAVGWKFIGPYGFSLPEEILEAISDEQAKFDSTITGSALVVYNYSGVSKAEFRVLYSGSFKFRPKVSYGRRSVPVKWEHDSENNEFVFYDTPPNESIEIELFNVDENFSVDQVLVDGKLITKFMSKRAMAQAYPDLSSKILLISLPVVCTLAIALSAYASYTAYKQRQDNNFVNEALAGYSGCALSVYENPPGKKSREELTRKIKRLEPWMKQVLLEKNKVSTEADLYDLDRVIICTPAPI